MKLTQSFRNSYRVFSRIWRHRPLLTTIWLLLPIASGLLTYPLYGARKNLIDLIVVHLGTDFQLASFLWIALPVVTLLFLTTVGQFLLTSANQLLTLRLRDQGTLLIRESIWKKAFTLDYELIERNQTQDRIQRAHQFVGDQLLQLASSQTESVRILLTLFAMLGVIWTVNPWIALLVTAVSTPALWIKIRIEIAIKSLNRDATHDGRRTDYLNSLLTKKDFAKEVRIFGFAPHLLGQFEDLMTRVLINRGNLRRTEIKTGAGIGLCNLLVFGVALYLLASDLHGAVSIGEATVVIWAVLAVQQTILQLVTPVQSFVTSALSAQELLEFLRLQEPEQAKPDVPIDTLYTIEFRHVSFRYPNSERLVLQDLNFKINRGEKIAIVGENGSGKSTMIKLLLGIYEPTEGSILINGRDLRDYSRETLYKKLSVLLQNFTKFPLTFQENIEIGNLHNHEPATFPAAATSDSKTSDSNPSDRLSEFLDNLHFREVIDSTPHGWQTHLGGYGEATYELSGGQWSLLAMARSTIKPADLVILDELSSALDPLAEVDVFRHYQKLFQHETVVLISHRLGWARYSDRILVIQQGRLIEMGTHQELMAHSREYAHMYNTQAQWYAS